MMEEKEGREEDSGCLWAGGKRNDSELFYSTVHVVTVAKVYRLVNDTDLL